MAGRVISFGGAVLSLVILAGTWLYVAGAAPPFPANAWTFNGVLLLCVVYGLVFGRGSRFR